MKKVSGAEALVQMLQLHGVKYIFGLCGDTSLPFYDAMYRLDHGITHVLTRDERSAAYMADVYARVSGKVGVCEGPSGGGATYILPGVVEANESSIPLLAITTDISVSGRGHYTLTELDQEGLFKPITKWSHVIETASKIPESIRAAFTHMTTGRSGAVHIGLPLDIKTGFVDETDIWADKSLGSYPSRRVAPDSQAVTVAADVILTAKKPLFICGGGPIISGAEKELCALAELLKIPVSTSISGKGSIPDNHPLALGVVGSNGGTKQTRIVVNDADVIIFVGTRTGSVTTEKWQYPARGKTRIVHIDVDPAVIGANYETEAAIIGDARLCLEALYGEISRRPNGTNRRLNSRKAVEEAKAEKFADFNNLANSNMEPIKPEQIVAGLQEILPSDSIIVADPGTPCPYISAYFQLNRTGRTFITNRAHGALGYALPGIVGAYYGQPRSKCVGIIGDGSFGFTSGELETITRLKLPVTMIVISNGSFGWIKAGQKNQFGGRYFSVDLNQIDHAKVAEAYGVKVWRVKSPDSLKPALSSAIEADVPTLVDIITQPLQEANAPVSEWIS